MGEDTTINKVSTWIEIKSWILWVTDHVSVHAHIVGQSFLTCLKYKTLLRTFWFLLRSMSWRKRKLSNERTIQSYQCYHIKSFISSSEVSAFDFVLQSDLLAAFWLFFPFWLILFLSTFCFAEPFPFLIFGTVPSWKARTDCSSSLCSFWWNRNVFWCF